MDCFECEKGIAKEEFGAYCSKKCRDKAINKLKQQNKQSKKRRNKAEIRKFEEYLKSGRRTY